MPIQRSDSLIHDAAWAMAQSLMAICGHCFREEEQRDLFDEFYRASREGIEAYHAQWSRMKRRITPTKN